MKRYFRVRPAGCTDYWTGKPLPEYELRDADLHCQYWDNYTQYVRDEIKKYGLGLFLGSRKDQASNYKAMLSIHGYLNKEKNHFNVS